VSKEKDHLSIFSPGHPKPRKMKRRKTVRKTAKKTVRKRRV
jgi:hypothetical protein